MESRRKGLLWISLGIASVAAIAFSVTLALRGSDHGPDVVSRRPALRPEEAPEAAQPVVSMAPAPKAPEKVLPPVSGLPPKEMPVVSPARERELQALKQEILNESAPGVSRVKALRKLRDASDDWKSPDIVGSMADLLRKSDADDVRMNICRYLRGADADIFKQQLLNSVSMDTSSGVRREATASLRPMAGDPVVQRTLREALAKERSPGVKTEIELTLIAGKSK